MITFKFFLSSFRILLWFSFLFFLLMKIEILCKPFETVFCTFMYHIYSDWVILGICCLMFQSVSSIMIVPKI
ncbi:hypothetical protein L6452_02896 [Arctium lappa]|uniref:Uncharacterized protein n=1 Tax=Arctium lappa TaxID=4217 RepID=A0ACB9FK70_ARCLA|nr:hypothetical protein L6452_02896 [Arctium lappa]